MGLRYGRCLDEFVHELEISKPYSAPISAGKRGGGSGEKDSAKALKLVLFG